MNGLDGINVSRRMSREVETGRKMLCALEKIVSRVKLKRKERSRLADVWDSRTSQWLTTNLNRLNEEQHKD
jgi:hypothetical protein